MIECVSLQENKEKEKKMETMKGHYIKDNLQWKPVRKWESDTFKGGDEI